MLRSFIGGKRKIAVLVTAVAALAIGVSVGVAKSGPSQLNVSVLKFNNNCPGVNTKKPISTAHVVREKGTITITGQVHGGTPGKHVLELYTNDAGVCNLYATIDTFKVDGSGDGNYAGTTFNSTQQSFVINLHNEDLGINNFSVPFKIGSS
jgi:hypothetical protein